MMAMRVLLAVALAFGCGNSDTVRPDAAIDDARLRDGHVPIDDSGFVPDFYGEPCSPPSTPYVANICRNDIAYPKALCTPAGICRPWCNHVADMTDATLSRTCENAGGVETWTGSAPGAEDAGVRGLCYCDPP